MPWPDGSQPYNFFAGEIPTSPGELAHVAGFYYVITSILVTFPAGASDGQIVLVDAEGNKRLQTTMGPPAGNVPDLLELHPQLVLGNVEGATIVCTEAGNYISIDGYGFAPQDSPIW